MSKRGMMQIEPVPGALWTLSEDRRNVRLNVPPLPMAGLAEPLKVHMDFDAAAIDELVSRLTMLRVQMLPAPKHN